MANSGFKGRVLQLSNLLIQGGSTGPSVSFNVLFMDGDGVVHAQTKHVVSLTDDPQIKQASKALLDACLAHAERLHFDAPNDPLKMEEIRRGIAETFVQDDADSDPGEQG
jgi:hypothetical protein